MILLDTNVVSEHLRPRPKLTVLGWIDAQPATTLYICTPVLAELRFGAERLQPGRKQTICGSRSSRSRIIFLAAVSYHSTLRLRPSTGDWSLGASGSADGSN